MFRELHWATCKLKHTLTWLKDGKVHIDYRPVHLHTLTDEVEMIPPKERIYCVGDDNKERRFN